MKIFCAVHSAAPTSGAWSRVHLVRNGPAVTNPSNRIMGATKVVWLDFSIAFLMDLLVDSRRSVS